MRSLPRASSGRRLLAGLSGMLVAGAALAPPAQAMLSATVSDSLNPGTTICSATDNLLPGILTLPPSSCKNQNFSSISGSVVGSMTLTTPDLSANQVSATTSSLTVPFPDTLTISIVQTGLSFAGGDATVDFGVSSLTGNGSSVTLTAQAPNGMTQVTQKFTSVNPPPPPVRDFITLPPVTSDAAIFSLTATGPNQTQATSIAIAAVVAPTTPEPGSLVLLGSALAGFGVAGLGRRRSRQRWHGAAAALPVRRDFG